MMLQVTHLINYWQEFSSIMHTWEFFQNENIYTTDYSQVLIIWILNLIVEW